MALINKLSAIGDAIREKTGKEDLLTLDQMPEEIKGISGGGAEVEPIVIDSQASYACAGAVSSAYIDLFGDTITTQGLRYVDNMFYKNLSKKIPFDLNFDPTYSGIDMKNMFYYAENLKELPKIIGASPSSLSYICCGCYNLREIPDDYFDSWDFSYMDKLTGTYTGICNYMFQYCYSLRKCPLGWLKYTNPSVYESGCCYSSLFSYCFVLDEVVDLPVVAIDTTPRTANIFHSTFVNCHRIKNFTFAKNEDGSPVSVKWKKQTIDLTQYVGYSSKSSSCINYNSGITADKEVKDDATYQALKNDPDWFSTDIAYSRYNHDSAVATINSLPDTSAYLATAGGTNTIKFSGRAGSKTDGGAINTLTEEEIAVATNKGWTITLV